ncbi:MAG: ribosome small subunit-dependent GTPase A [Paludibacteraceae bacterium]|nr:ribosome small subunit-dependent GTPase A [Paludibacteraceae bacterium]
MRGLVIKSTGSSYIVRLDDGSDVECRVKGNFRIRGIRSTNPVAVGDFVEIKIQEDGTHWISEIEERRNYIIRRATNLSKESHILAANIDQAALIVTVNHPVTSTTFIDRFLATCEAYRVRAVLIFNKIDLLSDEEMAHLTELQALYESIGYQTISLSALHLQHPTSNTVHPTPYTLHKILQGRVTLLSGNSGVGKSTLLNALFGKEMTRTGKISDAHDKGMHTTTFSEMYPLPTEWATSGWLIDTPGIKGFGSVDMEKEEISHYFPEIFRVSSMCRFGNCSHTNEPGCAVQDALVKGEIAISRYESYLSLLGDCAENKYR